jgi:hypothetical protein
MTRSQKRGLVAFAGALAISSVVQAAFIAGDLVAVQAGDGSAGLVSAATPGFVKEFSPAGTSVGSTVNLPTSASGANMALTLSGTATSEGFLQITPDGQYMAVAGYNAAVGTATITTSNSSAITRVIGRIDMSGNVDTTTGYNEAGTPGNPRSGYIDGTNAWMGTSAGGVKYVPFGSVSSSVQLSAAPTNTRVVNVFGGQLYVTSASGTTFGVMTVGSGEPTTSGQTSTLLPGFPTTAGPSSYDYYFKDASTLYVADDRAASAGGGIQKWTLSGGTWSLAYTLNTGNTTGYRGLAAEGDGSGNLVLYGTSTETSANKIWGVIDTGASSPFFQVAQAPTNTAFRGVEVVPGGVAPEPGSLALLAGGVLMGLRRRRAK